MKRLIWLINISVFYTIFICSCEKEEGRVINRTCTVTFIQNLTNAAGDTLLIEVQAGELISDSPDLTREGFVFDGWYTNLADANPNPTKNTNPPKFPSYDILTKPIYLDVILYARWIK